MIVNLSLNGLKIEDIAPGSFYVCQYENDWYFGIASFVSMENQDLNIKFLHPKGPAVQFFWPTRDDICWIPISNVICKLSHQNPVQLAHSINFKSLANWKPKCNFIWEIVLPDLIGQSKRSWILIKVPKLKIFLVFQNAELLELYDFYAVHNSIMHFAFQPLPVPWQMFFEHTIFSKLVCPICTTVIWTTVKLYEQAQIFWYLMLLVKLFGSFNKICVSEL